MLMNGEGTYIFTDDIFPIYINVDSMKLHHARDFSGNFYSSCLQSKCECSFEFMFK